MPRRVLISGAGIAGPALAHWLIRLGYSVVVVERASSLRENGQQIDLRAQAIEVIKHMGLLPQIQEIVVDEAGLQFVDTNGKRIGVFPKDASRDGGRGFTSEFEMMRGDLCKVLYTATKDQCDYRWGQAVDSFVNGDDAVDVTFSDGTSESFDLLVAADGQESRIRKVLLGEEAETQAIRRLGVFCSYYTIRREAGDEQIATAYQAPQRRVLSTRYHTDKLGQGYLLTMARGDEFREAFRQDAKSQKATFAKVFEDAGWQASRLIQAMHDADDFYAHELVQVHSPTWSKGRVVLLGDAGYAPSPLTGMGSSLALLGAYVLAGELSRSAGDANGIPNALKAFEKAFKPYVEKVQRLPRGVPDVAYPDSKWTIKLMNGVIGLVAATRLNKVIGYMVQSKREGWELPPPPQEIQDSLA